MRRGCFSEAEKHFRKAIERCTWKNPNPYDSEPYYNLGLSLWYQRRMDEAFDAFYKASWSNEQQEMSFYYLGCIEAARGNLESALELTEKGLVKNGHNVKARGLKAYLLRRLERLEEAKRLIAESLKLDSFDYISRLELARIDREHREALLEEVRVLARNFRETYLMIVRDYAEYGAFEEAVQALGLCRES